jgi:hypothetical protein
MDTDQELTYEQKSYNYCRLVETIQFIEEEGRITEDWMEDHKTVIYEYRNAFPNSLKTLNPEFKNKEFRLLASQADVLLNSLTTSIEYEQSFKVGQYHKLLQRLLRMLEIISSHDNTGDDLSAFLQAMSLE